MKLPEPVAYLVLGCYVHPGCSNLARFPSSTPVYAHELPPIVFCRGCEDQILPESCVFCDIVAGQAPVEWILSPGTWHDAVAFVPKDPITEGHCLIAPKRHVKDFAQDPETFADTARRAAELMRWTDRPMNLISTRGRDAGQEIMHLHLHLIPREAGDGIRLLTKKAVKRDK
jgi:histidine triad (HIT) family protein